MPNQGLLAIAFFEASAFLILLVLFSLLGRDLSARFFRLWFAGWALLTGYGATQVLYILRGGTLARVTLHEFYSAATCVFFVAVLVYTGRTGRHAHLRLLVSL